ncbi:importin subunit alpha-3 [Drosophila obscura]|uniref:importin subunit alpha-3 n=1 Tax=Drosophila obscura TaxID=7282 RepID=UPI001BB2ACF4|nr:importin subunit alpha-3 [Drosophila obscura]
MIKSTIDANELKLYSIIVFKQLAMDASKPEQQFDAVQAARKLLSSDKNPPINEVIQSGMLPILVECLRNHNRPLLQFEAAWALTNIASGTSDQTNQVVGAGAVPVFVQLLGAPAERLREQAVWALGNIIGDSPLLCSFAVNHGVVQPLLSFAKLDTKLSLLQIVVWAIVNLCRSKGQSLPTGNIHEILNALNVLVDHTDTNILVDTVWATSYLTDGGSERIQMVIESGVVPKLIPLLGSGEVKVQIAALRAVVNIVSGSDDQAQVVLNCGALYYITVLLSHPDLNIRKNAVWFLSNVAAGNQAQLQAIINMGLVPQIIENLRSVHFKMQTVASWAVSNAILIGNREQVYTLIKEGVVAPFCDILSCQDTPVIMIVLEALDNMLKSVADSDVKTVANLVAQCGGLAKIESLLDHQAEEIHTRAQDIIDQYFTD